MGECKPLDQGVMTFNPSQRKVAVARQGSRSSHPVTIEFRLLPPACHGSYLPSERMDETTTELIEIFFDRYQQSLLARDSAAVADLYAVPALIVFPDNVVAVSDQAQTVAFFDSAWSQYEGVDIVDRTMAVMGIDPGHCIWADVTWSHDGKATERFCYQLVLAGDKWRIAVLTPITLDT